MNTKEKLMGPPFYPPAPHVVILGAGASKAAFCSGDRERRLIPLMDEIPAILGESWAKLISDAKPPFPRFEQQFSWLRDQPGSASALSDIEREIIDYFSSLKLPDHPTIYDYIVLGLRPKDVVATFNWDPFLLLAHIRNRSVGGLPDIRFLHGCVRYGTCADHDVLGERSEGCPICDKALGSGKIFFPDDHKDYDTDPLVQRDWHAVVDRLKLSFHLTIFGYSGPQTDYKARELLRNGWGKSPIRPMTHVEIIDVETDEILRTRWKDFIPFQHDMVTPDFWCSTIAQWPRRTAEYKLSASLEGIPSEPIGPFHTKSLHELQDWHAELVRNEPEPGEDQKVMQQQSDPLTPRSGPRQ